MSTIYQILENMSKVCKNRLEEAEEGLLIFQHEIKKQIELDN